MPPTLGKVSPKQIIIVAHVQSLRSSVVSQKNHHSICPMPQVKCSIKNKSSLHIVQCLNSHEKHSSTLLELTIVILFCKHSKLKQLVDSVKFFIINNVLNLTPQT